MKCKDILCFFSRNNQSDGKRLLIKSLPTKKKKIRETRKWVPHNKTKPLPYPVKQLELHKGGQEEPSMLITAHGPKTAERIFNLLYIYTNDIGYEEGRTPEFSFESQKGAHRFLVQGDLATALHHLNINKQISDPTMKEAISFFKPSVNSSLQY